MDVRTIEAPTMAEALNKAKAEVGTDAVVLRTQQVTKKRFLGLAKKVTYRLTVGRNLPRPRRPIVPAPVMQSIAPVKHSAAPAKPEPGQALMQMPIAQVAALKSINQEVADLKQAVDGLVRITHKQVVPDMPEGLHAFYLRLLENEVAEEMAGRIVEKIRADCRPDRLADPHYVRARLAEILAGLVPTSGAIQRSRADRPHVIALVGPTGVGKTTTVAKLAANLKLREGHSVGMITIDTYRMGAVDQLKKYADIIGSRLAVVASPGDLGAAMRQLADCDYILIDTAGRSPKDEKQLTRMKKFLEAARPDEVHLVLAAASGRKQIELIADRYGKLGIDRIIFTKLDEAAQVGIVLSVAEKLQAKLSYVTTGQDVPNDIEVGDGRKLALMILGTDPDPTPSTPDDDANRPAAAATMTRPAAAENPAHHEAVASVNDTHVADSHATRSDATTVETQGLSPAKGRAA